MEVAEGPTIAVGDAQLLADVDASVRTALRGFAELLPLARGGRVGRSR